MARAGVFVLLALGAAAASPPAHAWGDEGHRIVALIAEHYLTPRARQRVDTLLAGDRSGLVADTSMASEATWADRYRDSDRNDERVRYERTYRWHFIDLALSRPDLDRPCFDHPALTDGTPASAGPAEDCVVDKIDQFAAELVAPKTAPDERRVALQFLLHLVGDVHQPLHAATDHDAGGNRKRVATSRHAAASLHAYWDVNAVRSLGPEPDAVAARLISRIRPDEINAWSGGTPSAWAIESNALARTVAYGELPSPDRRGRYRLSDRYRSAARVAVAGQLSRAGVRLAAVLNRALQ